MLDLKPYGAFVEHTIRPLIEESDTLLKAISKLDLKKQDVEKTIKGIAFLHVFTTVLDIIKTIICTIIVGYVILKISNA